MRWLSWYRRIIKAKNGNERLAIAFSQDYDCIVALIWADPSELDYCDDQQQLWYNKMLFPWKNIGRILHASLITSANDATLQIKTVLNQISRDICQAMNVKARIWSYEYTFSNAEGFDNPDNFSSAKIADFPYAYNTQSCWHRYQDFTTLSNEIIKHLILQWTDFGCLSWHSWVKMVIRAGKKLRLFTQHVPVTVVDCPWCPGILERDLGLLNY